MQTDVECLRCSFEYAAGKRGQDSQWNGLLQNVVFEQGGQAIFGDNIHLASQQVFQREV